MAVLWTQLISQPFNVHWGAEANPTNSSLQVFAQERSLSEVEQFLSVYIFHFLPSEQVLWKKSESVSMGTRHNDVLLHNLTHTHSE
jgi:hypothetical protein